MGRLSTRQLNRATLARQFLLDRTDRSVPDAVAALVGLQAQTPHTWYVGVFSRIRDCRPQDVAALLVDRRLVRIVLMRSTIHLVTAADAAGLRPLIQPVLDRGLAGGFGRALAGVDRNELAEAGARLVADKPRTWAELGRLLSPRWPDRDPAALAQAVRCWVPLVQMPPRGVWGASGTIAHTSLRAWVGAEPAPALTPADLIRRYLAAFGPASVRDAQTWCGLTRLAEVVDGLRGELMSWRGPSGVELFDLPDAPRPDPDIPAPPRFLYDFDNLYLSHADRSRVITEEYRSLFVSPNGQLPQSLLLDGRTAGTWTVARTRDSAVLTVRPFRRLPAATADAVTAEGARLLDFVAADRQDHEIHVVPPD
jgi:Winged helix DNA-binding domain